MATIQTDEDLQASIARTAQKYDQLPYQSKPFGQSQPARLSGIAQLFGLETAPLKTARVLELGSAAGGNIIPHAIRFPEASFVGIDLAPTQVAAGQAHIARLGLKNIEIRCQSLTEVGEELGSFDYIICHGVFSWVPTAVQEAIFRVVQERLSPVGVACVSYNVLPGWRTIQPVRDAFLMQTADETDSLKRVAKARDLLAFLSKSTVDQGAYGATLRAWAERMPTFSDAYIAHEFLEDVNEPCMVREFVTRAGEQGLGFLAECEFFSMILDNYGADIAAAVRQRTGNDFLESEQYIDLLSGRTFRQSLLVAKARMANVSRIVSPEKLASLSFLASGGMKVTREGDAYAITNGPRTLKTASAVVAAGIERLIERTPASSTVDDCIEALSGEDREQARKPLLETFYRLLLGGMVNLSGEVMAAGLASDKKPKALAIAQADAIDGADSTTNMRHEPVALNVGLRALLSVLDGTRDRAALIKHLTDEALAGRLNFNRKGEEVTGAKAVKAVVTEHLPVLLSSIARSGLLEAAAKA